MQIPTDMVSAEERIATAVRCRDCDDLPKVPDAGRVLIDKSGKRCQIMHNGLRVIADGYCGAWMTDLIRNCQGHHEPQEERIFHDIIKQLPRNATLIELGGYWAYYSLWFLLDNPDRRAVVLEPDPRHLAVGRENALLNHLTPKFISGFASTSKVSNATFQTDDSEKIQIPSFTVDSLIATERWDNLSMLHLDIQGGETDILKSCERLFSQKRVGWVLVSTHAHQISGDPLTHQRCLEILRNSGAVIEAEHDVHESFSGDGLIAARFSPAPAQVPLKISYNRQDRSLFRHLAYDLDQCRTQLRNLEKDKEVSRETVVNAQAGSLEPSGILYTLKETGSLGQAGDRILLPNDKVISPEVARHGAWDLTNLRAFRSKLNPQKNYTLIDIGANIGLFSRQLLADAPFLTKTLCVEPEAGNYAALLHNLAHFNNRVQFYNFALGRDNGKAKLFRDTSNIGNYSLNADAMRARSYDQTEVEVRSVAEWMTDTLSKDGSILWKSDTQGYDELIVSETPEKIWKKIDVALMELWRIEKPSYNVSAFERRIESFPNRSLGGKVGVNTREIMNYLNASDWQFLDLLLWR
ncbi:MAG: FkbM family methyltransferase [Pseudomonadota bacterium]|nr:FkbM family methyltransferase [Pseudomonadota bacterium]